MDYYCTYWLRGRTYESTCVHMSQPYQASVSRSYCKLDLPKQLGHYYYCTIQASPQLPGLISTTASWGFQGCLGRWRTVWRRESSVNKRPFLSRRSERSSATSLFNRICPRALEPLVESMEESLRVWPDPTTPASASRTKNHPRGAQQP